MTKVVLVGNEVHVPDPDEDGPVAFCGLNYEGLVEDSASGAYYIDHLISTLLTDHEHADLCPECERGLDNYEG